jgi:hypothetical protein
MGKGTLALLFVLVLGLGALWLARARETLRGGPALDEYPLCPALALERVRQLRVEHLERGFQLRFERDAAGRWYLTDPLNYPAQGALVRTLLEMLAQARGEPAPEVRKNEVGLDPPQVVLELVQVDPDGEHTLRIELGSLDLDPARIYARVPDHPNAARGGTDVFRTTRVLANTLERSPDDYREGHATALRAQDVISIRRRGQIYRGPEEGVVDLAFDALAGPDGWKRVGQPTVSLDPNAMGLLARGAAELEVERFVDDSPTDLASYGLAEPLFTLELEPVTGSPVVLAFGHPATSQPLPPREFTWYCQRQGYAHVWEVSERAVELLTQPAELFFDQLVMRSLRADVRRLELEGAGGRRVIARERDGWSVWNAADEGEARAHHPGNTPTVEEALALLERTQLVEHFAGEAFEPLDPPCAFTLVLANGARVGGRLGRATRDPKSGAEGPQFLRDGDEVVALVDAQLLSLCQRPLDDFRARKLHQIQEGLARAVELELPGKNRRHVYVNSGNNQWTPEGETIGAPAGFVQSLDSLLNLAVVRWLADEPGDEPVLAVRVLLVQGEPQSFTFARASSGAMVCTSETGQRAEVDAALVQRLLELF